MLMSIKINKEWGTKVYILNTKKCRTSRKFREHTKTNMQFLYFKQYFCILFFDWIFKKEGYVFVAETSQTVDSSGNTKDDVGADGGNTEGRRLQLCHYLSGGRLQKWSLLG